MTNHFKYIIIIFFLGSLSHRFKHNHNKPYQHRCQDSGWHGLSICDATALLDTGSCKFTHLVYTSRHQGQPLQFCTRNTCSLVIMLYTLLLSQLRWLILRTCFSNVLWDSSGSEHPYWYQQLISLVIFFLFLCHFLCWRLCCLQQRSFCVWAHPMKDGITL